MVLGFALMMSMTGKEEQNDPVSEALADMSNEAVEYVRGIPVVKTFGQTVYSFKKFKGASTITSAGSAYTIQAALAYDCLYAGNQQRVCVPDRRRLSRSPTAETDGSVLLNLLFLHHHHAGHLLTMTKLMFMSETA